MKKNVTKARLLAALTESGPSETQRAFSMVIGAFANDRRVAFGGSKGFGSRALKIDGKLFAMISAKGRFVVKLPTQRVDDLVRQGIGEYFTSGTGRLMKEWFALDGEYSIWIKLATEARNFVAVLASGNKGEVSKKTRPR